MDHAGFDWIAGLRRGLLNRLGDRLSSEVSDLISEFVDVGELGLALEWMADAMSDAECPVDSDERVDMLLLVDVMKMDDRVGLALSRCPLR